MDIEIREVTPLPSGRLPSIEAMGRSRKRASGSLYEVEIREPGTPGSANKSESAASSGIINLQENNGMNIQNQLPTSQDSYEQVVESFMRLGFSEASARRATADLNPGSQMRETVTPSSGRIEGMGQSYGSHSSSIEDSRKEMFEAFQNLGFSEASAKQAADDLVAPYEQENFAEAIRRDFPNIDTFGAGEIRPGATVFYHPTAAELAAMDHFEAERDREAKINESNEAQIKEALGRIQGQGYRF